MGSGGADVVDAAFVRSAGCCTLGAERYRDFGRGLGGRCCLVQPLWRNRLLARVTSCSPLRALARASGCTALRTLPCTAAACPYNARGHSGLTRTPRTRNPNFLFCIQYNLRLRQLPSRYGGQGFAEAGSLERHVRALHNVLLWVRGRDRRLCLATPWPLEERDVLRPVDLHPSRMPAMFS